MLFYLNKIEYKHKQVGIRGVQLSVFFSFYTPRYRFCPTYFALKISILALRQQRTKCVYRLLS